MIGNIVKSLLSKRKKLMIYLLLLLYKVKLLPKEFHKRALLELSIKKHDKYFNNLKLSYNNLGFHFVDPLPDDNYLKSYYRETYSDNRHDFIYPVRNRDLQHYELLCKNYPDFNLSKKRVLNFGSGHGGVSFLLALKNHEINNFDFQSPLKKFEENWNNLDHIDKINGKFDLIYSSHSLEHVQNIFETIKKFSLISNENTIFFFEVPNCSNKKYQKIHCPHTYYFTKLFFNNCFKKIDVCKFYFGEKEVKNDLESNILRILTRDKILLLNQN